MGALLAYGAPVILSGHATFTGFVKLDDTATWLNVVDVIMFHGRSVAGIAPSTFPLNFTGDIGAAYPLGGFVLLGVGHGLTGIDAAWIFQPYEACCAAALALCIYALVEPVVSSPRTRALIGFLAAQPALLYGYAMWGGIKEVTAAFLLALGVALAARTLRAGGLDRAEVAAGDGHGEATIAARSGSFALVREVIPTAIAAGALVQVLGIGAGGWVAPALLLVVALWVVQSRSERAHRLALVTVRTVALIAIAAVCVIPVWVVLSHFLGNDSGLFNEGQSAHTKFGNLLAPLRGWQLAGIWPVGDFRDTVTPSPWTSILIAVVIVSALAGVAWGAMRRQFGVALYVAVALLSSAIFVLAGATPWVTGKAFAISSPALLTAALAAAGMLWSARRRELPPIAGASQIAPEAAPATPPPSGPGARAAQDGGLGRLLNRLWPLGPVIFVLVAVGVLWSNVLAYHEVTVAPRARLAELQQIGTLVNHKGPTFANMYEVYADRHFLRGGAPTEPAEYREATLPLRDGAILTDAAWADLNAFSPGTLEPYRSIVTQNTPAESRPPSTYEQVFKGRFYNLYQRTEPASIKLLEQIEYGESNAHPYCGNSSNDPASPICSMVPVGVPSCPQVHAIARGAEKEGATLIAFQRAAPTVARGDELRWPGYWNHEVASHAIEPTAPGTAVAHMIAPTSQRYELWLSGDFTRGFEVTVDGHHVGNARNEPALFNEYAHVADVNLSAGVHTIEFTYPERHRVPRNPRPRQRLEPVHRAERHLPAADAVPGERTDPRDARRSGDAVRAHAQLDRRRQARRLEARARRPARAGS